MNMAHALDLSPLAESLRRICSASLGFSSARNIFTQIDEKVIKDAIEAGVDVGSNNAARIDMANDLYEASLNRVNHDSFNEQSRLQDGWLGYAEYIKDLLNEQPPPVNQQQPPPVNQQQPPPVIQQQPAPVIQQRPPAQQQQLPVPQYNNNNTQSSLFTGALPLITKKSNGVSSLKRKAKKSRIEPDSEDSSSSSSSDESSSSSGSDSD